jgi:hypothetical protein
MLAFNLSLILSFRVVFLEAFWNILVGKFQHQAFHLKKLFNFFKFEKTTQKPKFSFPSNKANHLKLRNKKALKHNKIHEITFITFLSISHQTFFLSKKGRKTFEKNPGKIRRDFLGSFKEKLKKPIRKKFKIKNQ